MIRKSDWAKLADMTLERRLAILPSLVLAASSHAAVITSTWVGPANGSWNVAGNWSPVGVPFNGTNLYNVVINAGGRVSMPTSVTVNQITISANATLTVQNGAVAGVVAGIVNNGVVQLNAAANSAELQTFGPATFITGSGVIQGTDTTNNRLSTHDAASTWTLGASQTLRGGLRISGMWVENDGTIEASLPSGIQLTLLNHPVAGTPSLNLGVLRAKTGSTLTLSGCQLDSSAGFLDAAGGTISFTDAGDLYGGTLNSASGGSFTVAGNAAHFHDVTNNGTFNVPAGAIPKVHGTIVNNGAIHLSATTLATSWFYLSDPVVTLTGTGVLDSTDVDSKNRITTESSTKTLIHGAGHTIKGSVGIISLNLINYGLIDATQTAPLYVTPWGDVADNANLGVMRASTGGTLALSGSFDNSAGTIVAAGGTVRFDGHVVGGLILGRDGGVLTSGTNGSGNLEAVTVDGAVSIPNGSSISLSGDVTLLQPCSFNSTTLTTTLKIQPPGLTLAGPGDLVFAPTTKNAIAYTQSVYDDLVVNAAGHTIRGPVTVNVRLLNQGSIVVEGSPAKTILGGFRPVVNEGLLHVTASGECIVGSTVPFENHGVVLVEAGGVLNTSSTDYLQEAGVTRVDGTLGYINFHGDMVVSGGRLEGSGVLAPELTWIDGGTLAPGDGTGPLTFTTPLVMTERGRMAVGPAGRGGAYSNLLVQNIVLLGGTLVVEPPAVASDAPVSHVIVEADAVFGTFDAVESCVPVEVVYGSNTVVVSFASLPPPGDLTGDGAVNGADLGALLAAWGPCPAEGGCCDGDFNRDGVVDGADLAFVLASWG